MGTSKNDILRMIEECGDVEFVMIVTDTFDYTTYGVGVSEEDFARVYGVYNNYDNMSRVMEVYDLSLDLFTQLQEKRARHFPEGFLK